MHARPGCAGSVHTTTPDALNACLPVGATGVLVALSGGADSCALLAAATRLREVRPQLSLRAVHIDHGLQPAAASFRAACSAVCARLEVPLTVIAVEIVRADGSSLEEAARDARYGALRAQLAAGECLLTAHHALDQAETLLLQALRGAGLKGMSGMPACREFGAGWHVRPFLDVPRQELLMWSAALPAEHCEDPMNADSRFDRAYLRQHLWPGIERRWPGAGLALARAARHAAQAQALLDDTASFDLGRLRDGEALSVPGLRALPPLRRFNAVRLWVREFGVDPPSTARLDEFMRQVLDARPESLPATEWAGHALRRYRQRLFLTDAHPAHLQGMLEWRIGSDAPLCLGSLGSLVWTRQKGGIDAKHRGTPITVQGRRGGETLKVAAAAKTHTLQHLCQEIGVLPWMRDALPLLFAHGASAHGASAHGAFAQGAFAQGASAQGASAQGAFAQGASAQGALIAVADLWLEARWCTADAVGFAPKWCEAPIII
jgi:tRNA(Ile)-lysidine synthase